MAVQTIFNATLTSSFVASDPFLIVDGLAVADFSLRTTAGPAEVEWYYELTSDNPVDATTEWFREVAEELPGVGYIDMPPAVRRFSNLTGTQSRDVQTAKTHMYCRVQLRKTTGSIDVIVKTPFGLPTYPP